MGKQTMGTPTLAYRKRNDNKLYYITTPQAPLVRTRVYTQHALDDYAMGTNAIVAVLSYTVKFKKKRYLENIYKFYYLGI
jgi:DNA-directed RNA polymerase I subunit RPA2